MRCSPLQSVLALTVSSTLAPAALAVFCTLGYAQKDPAAAAGPSGQEAVKELGQRSSQVLPQSEPFQPILQGDKDGFTYPSEFFTGGTYDPTIRHPAGALGQPVGSRMARPDEIVQIFKAWSKESNRMVIGTHGQTYEGREMLHAIITSPENHARLAEIKAANARLTDPRGLTPEAAKPMLQSTPAVAYMGYSIHGDETSGADASLAVAYHLIACEDPAVESLLNDVVVVLEPQMNPDGRGRIVAMVQQYSGYRASLDFASMARGSWPYGRGNHYLFDVNRDWMAGVAPETRARWSLLTQWTPQLFVDAHEMSGLDTFLMYPQATPRHHAMPTRLTHWQGVFADDHGKAFDAFGWGYYTREWADGWYPGYSDSWGSLNGAIGMLYEQGSNRGQPLKREGGEVVPYREAVHGQYVASLANLGTLQKHRVEVRTDAFEHRVLQMKPSEGKGRVWLVEDRRLGSRTDRLLSRLQAQGIEVHRIDDEPEARDVVSHLGQTADTWTVPAGTFAVPLAQPQGALVRAYLEFDPRIDLETLKEERERLERGDGSRLYDVTAWDLARQYGVTAHWATIEGDLGAPIPPIHARPFPTAQVSDQRQDPIPAYAFVVDGRDDRVLHFASLALEAGLVVHVADKPFAPDLGVKARRSFDRGSLLLRRHENAEALVLPAEEDRAVSRSFESVIKSIAVRTEAAVFAVAGGRAGDLENPDLGGGHFERLAQPKIALLSGPPLVQHEFGHVWQYLDEELRAPVSLVAAERLGGVDLRRYNVLVIPTGGVGQLVSENWESLRTWVRSGGTLIAIGGGASAFATSKIQVGDVRRRSQVLGDLDKYLEAARRQRNAGSLELDWAEVWGDPVADNGDAEGDKVAEEDAESNPTEPGLAHLDGDDERADALARRYMPVGSILRAEVDVKSWLAYGADSEMAVPFSGSTVLLSTGEVPVRMAERDAVRLAGLVWPEARVRLENGAWLARERMGNGQVILFAHGPCFRGSWHGTARLLGNAVLFGPGLGARQPSDW